MRLSNADETESHLSLGGNHPLFKAYDGLLTLKKCCNGERCMFTFGVTGSNRQAKFALAEVKRAINTAGGTYIASSFMGGICEHSRFRSFRSPYFRNGLWEHGYSVDTFETCIKWDKVTACMNEMEQAIRDASDEHGIGRDHAPWLHVEKGAEGMALIETMVKHFDPNKQLNPGCLIPEA